MKTHCILLGMVGWTSVIETYLIEAGYEVEPLPKLNALLVYNATAKRLRNIITARGFGGGKIIQIEE